MKDRTQRTPFLTDAWYCASWANELGDELLARTILEIPVLLYRTEDGRAVAVKDECPHRFAPLSMGRRDGDAIVCPYHGLSFTPQGACRDSRFTDLSRKATCLRTFPLVERHNVIWIWMGSPALADDRLIPDYSFFDNPQRPKFFGYTHVQANYELETDNLLDLSHLDYVHTASIAQDLSKVGTFSVSQEGNRVGSLWRAMGVPMPALWAPFFPGEEGKVDMWMDMYWEPASSLMLDTGTKLTGAPREQAIGTLQGHFPTPETRFTTHYFWGVTVHSAMGPAIEQVRLGTIQAFEHEDQPLIEAIQRRMGSDDFWAKRPLIMLEDGAGVRARRLLDKLIREAGRTEPTLEAAE